MCGINGFLSPPAANPGDMHGIITGMSLALSHRGPDSQGIWQDPMAGIALGHRRLAILDLTQEGHQPMHSAQGRYVIIYNGEVYNFQALRDELGHVNYRGHSDTEVILAGVEAWGLEATLQKMHGMFALALWDRRQRELLLARDRAGEKPLYYGCVGSSLVFASELKALRCFPGWTGKVNPRALGCYFHLGYVPAPASIYQGIYKLPPAACLRMSAKQIPDLPAPRTYWSADELSAEPGLADGCENDQETIARLEQLLLSAVGQQMISDVPLGAFLSGGIDSSLVVALMQAQSARPVKTFSIGFQESGYNEAPFAAAMARQLGTNHTELYVTSRQALDVVPRLPQIYDEPFADSSQIPTYLVSQLARQHVTVSLSGDAGDELFGGYDRYYLGLRLQTWLRYTPDWARRGLSDGILAKITPSAWDRKISWLRHLPVISRFRVTGDRIHKLAGLLNPDGSDSVYASLLACWPDPQGLLIESPSGWEGIISDSLPAVSSLSPLRQMMSQDFHQYLPGDILAKVDRAAMAVSLETRIPMLDPRVMQNFRMIMRDINGMNLAAPC